MDLWSFKVKATMAVISSATMLSYQSLIGLRKVKACGLFLLNLDKAIMTLQCHAIAKYNVMSKYNVM